jgi:TetR/AcrR family transcriptional regulator, regulator of autoinduction and epiphytic fitness
VQEAPPTDGRTLRSQRTREAIVDATISLLEEGDLRPTAPRVAERASVSVRSVFQHFAELERLHASVAERLVERVAVLLLPVAPDLPFRERLSHFLHQRCQLLEAVSPIRRAAEVHAPFSTDIRAFVRDGQAFLRAELEYTFGPELSAVPASERDELLDALDVALSWSTWEVLRTGLGRDHAVAEATMHRLATSLLR